MKARLILIAAGGALVGALALAPPAEAGHLDWSFGAGFHVGGLHFRVGFAPLGHAGYPGPFFLTTHRLAHRGYSCNGACFRRGAGYYHHAACPLLGFHLRGFGYGSDYFVLNFSPYGYGPSHRHYRGRSQPYHYRDGYRERFRSPGGRYYRDRGVRGRHDRDRRPRDHRADRGRGRDYRRGDDGDSDRRRDFRDDRGRRGRDGERGRTDRRRGAHRTRPPG